MTHYAKLAAIGFRLLAVVQLFEFLPGLLTVIRFARPGVGPAMPISIFAAVLIHPILAGVLFFFARPLGEFVAQGFEQ